MIRLILISLLFTSSVSALEPAQEIGSVRWGRDLSLALKKSAQTQKPVLVLFQEVPGCHGCKKFGKEVLNYPLLVEAIETEFHPVLVYNNRKGKDAELLKRFNEPSWNYQVIRFLDSSAKDIIPRRDKVWTIPGVVSRMLRTLNARSLPLPKYLSLLEASNNSRLEQLAFRQHCFWTGEVNFGSIKGVVKTEAGFLEQSEVTRVWFDPKEISAEQLTSIAAQRDYGGKVYGQRLPEKLSLSSKQISWSDYRKAPESDQKRQIRGTVYLKLGLTDAQLTKVNAFARGNSARALEFLSPRQLKAYRGN